MKKIAYSVVVVVMVGILIIMGIGFKNIFTKRETEIYRFDEKESHIIGNCDYLTNEDKEQLNKILASNREVLMIFSDDNAITNETTISNVITKYTDDERVPYVIFKYSNETKTLSSISSKNVKFENVYSENVDFSYVYRFIPLAESLNTVLAVKQHNAEMFIMICALIFVILAIISFSKSFYELVKWNKGQGVLFKLTFSEKKLKIKFDKNDKEYFANKIEYNSGFESDKEYIVIDMNDIIKISYDTDLYYCFRYVAGINRNVGILDWTIDKNYSFKKCFYRK